MNRLVVGPFNRVEGDLEVRLSNEEGYVQSADVVSPMFRGYETILLDRAPEDALVITPRICGICSVSQTLGASYALAKLQDVEPPPNGRYASLLTHACENLADHLSHFYLFFMPDFAREDYKHASWSAEAVHRFATPGGEGRAQALEARARFLHVTGILAGKWPHTLALQPGGTTAPLDAGARVRLLRAIREYRHFLERYVFAGSLEEFAELESTDKLDQWRERASAGDLCRFLEIADDLDLWRSGPGADTLISYGAYAVDGAHIFKDGVWRNGAVDALDTTRIVEDNAFALYEGDPASPDVMTTRPAPNKADAYSWCRAPRYAGLPAETGAYARQLIDGAPLVRDIHAQFGSCVAGRILARWLETARLIPMMEKWAMALDLQRPWLVDGSTPRDGVAVGLVEAARGSLGHWVSVRNGVIANYQIIAPTTWNFSPRDANGVPGPLETALIGAPAKAQDPAPLMVQHIVRSFDPCMVCTAH